MAPESSPLTPWWTDHYQARLHPLGSAFDGERSVLPAEGCVWTLQNRVLKANLELLHRIRSLLGATSA